MTLKVTTGEPSATAIDGGMRLKVLDAAERVVSTSGVANLTLDAVARDAGVSKGGLLYHFPSKSSLVLAIVERLGKRCDERHADALLKTTGKQGEFTRAYLRARTAPREPGEALLQTALLAAAGTDPQFLQPFRDRLKCWQERLENDGIDPVLASIIRLAVDGLCLGELLGMPVPQGELRQQVLARLNEMATTDKGE